ncbi:putative sugar O-methyltransferase [Aquicella lusitana]|nr:putative sugar O-methyltransferase [Aquicella lusitana]
MAQILIPIDEIAGLLNWPEVLDDVKRMNGFNELIRLFNLYANEKNSVSKSSNCWVLLAAKNCDQLLEHGYNNFKRTIGHNYFNFLVQKGDAQIQAVESLLSEDIIESCRNTALSIPHDPTFPANEQFSYNYFVLLLWEYAKKIDTKRYLDRLEEPREGNPLLVFSNGKSMSQDLANSLIEYYSIDNAISFKNINTVLEIGSGYGRNAHVILTLNPKARVVLVDIMPALYIAQRYLSSVFHDRNIFRARNFDSYEEVRDEIERASIVFLLPHQLTLLPDKQFDLCINISSFGEMNLDQIQWYFEQINRLGSYFYMKQWDLSKNPFDGLVLHKNDYPCLENWQEIYSRNCAVQNEFFETLYQVNLT